MMLYIERLTCSPPSPWASWSRWVWCSGYSVVCTSSMC